MLKRPENITPEVQQILDNYDAEQKAIQSQHNKALGRIGGGTALMGLSGLPIFNVPYVGTGAGGALYELGQGITEGDKLPELAKRTGAGFAIGETVGAIPYAGKFAGKTKAGQAIGELGQGLGKKFMDSSFGQKVAEIAPKVEDLLMTDIKAFNPNKQTVYHGSPYDFAKFSNEAIGTGEGAQAHGYGHYAANSKDVADRYREGLSLRRGTATYKGKEITDDYKAEIQNIREFGKEGYLNRLNENLANEQQRLKDFENMLENETDLSYFEDLYGFSNGEKHYQDYLDRRMNIANNIIPNIKKGINDIKFSIGRTNGINESDIAGGQLYKLSIPKDDVMLREDELLAAQPGIITNIWDELKIDRLNKATKDIIEFKNALFTNDIDIRKAFKTNIYNEALKKAKNNPEKYKDLFFQEMDGKKLYGYLTTKLGNKKAATKYLQDKGIKGISYNGGIDGEARVIFNPDDIEIVRKYYNQPSLAEFAKKYSPNMGAISNSLIDE